MVGRGVCTEGNTLQLWSCCCLLFPIFIDQILAFSLSTEVLRHSRLSIWLCTAYLISHFLDEEQCRFCRFNFFLLKKCEMLTWETRNDTVFNSFKLSFQAAVTEEECEASVCFLNPTLISHNGWSFHKWHPVPWNKLIPLAHCYIQPVCWLWQ